MNSPMAAASRSCIARPGFWRFQSETQKSITEGLDQSCFAAKSSRAYLIEIALSLERCSSIGLALIDKNAGPDG